MATRLRRSQYWWDGEVREELLERLRQWLADAQDDGELVLSRRDAETAESALVEVLRQVPILEKALEGLLKQDAEAKKAIKDGKGPERFAAACRIKGWIPLSGQKTPKKYPPHDGLLLEHQYVSLTTREGQVTLDDEMAHYAIPAPEPSIDDRPVAWVLEEFLVTVDGCPREPWDAVQELADFYGSSPTAMLRELWRRHQRIELKRKQLVSAGDESAAMALPRLDTLPQMREVE